MISITQVDEIINMHNREVEYVYSEVDACVKILRNLNIKDEIEKELLQSAIDMLENINLSTIFKNEVK